MIKNMFTIKNLVKIIFVFSLVLILAQTTLAQNLPNFDPSKAQNLPNFDPRNPLGFPANEPLLPPNSVGNPQPFPPGNTNTINSNTSPCNSVTDLGSLLCNFQSLLNSIVPVLLVLGVVYFVWGVFQYFMYDSEEAKKRGRNHVVFGILGFVVILSLAGIVNLAVSSLNLTGGNELASKVSNLVVPAGKGNCGAITTASNFPAILDYLTCVIGQSVIPFIFAVAIGFFIWGGINFFIINADEEAKREQGKQFMIWGIIALTVMISIWGLVNVLGKTFGIDTSVLPTVHPPRP